MNILILHGPNLNMLEFRGEEYGSLSLSDLEDLIVDTYPSHNFDFFQSNYEGDLITAIQEVIFSEIDALIINPGAFTHYSYAIYDALLLLNIPTVEVHLTDIDNREDFRKNSVVRKACTGSFYGKQEKSYFEAIDYILQLL